MEAARLISGGEADVVLAIGQESMSLAPPHVLAARSGQKYGAMELVDSLERDGLTDAFEQVSMGLLTEDGNTDLRLGARRSGCVGRRIASSCGAHREFLAGEIEPYILETRQGRIVVAEDDGVRPPDTTVEILAGLRPSFAKEGTVTAGNSSPPITDGGAAAWYWSARRLPSAWPIPVRGVESHALVAGPDVRLHSQPANAIFAALKGGPPFQPRILRRLKSMRPSLGRRPISPGIGHRPKIVNARGGAIALGHPIGASGARIVGTLARQLANYGPGSIGAAGICGGGGQGSAVVLRAV